MDFKSVLEPYADCDADGTPRRTTEGQIKWLMRKGLPRAVIDQAILKVYNELQAGRVFKGDVNGTAGYYLDQYLLESAKEIQQAEVEKQARDLEAFLGAFKQTAVEQYIKAQRGSVWKRIKAVFKPS